MDAIIDKFINVLIGQVPDLVAFIVVVYYFLRSIEKKDKLFTESSAQRDTTFIRAMEEITNRLKVLEATLLEHQVETKEGMNEMRRTVSRAHRQTRKKV